MQTGQRQGQSSTSSCEPKAEVWSSRSHARQPRTQTGRPGAFAGSGRLAGANGRGTPLASPRDVLATIALGLLNYFYSVNSLIEYARPCERTAGKGSCAGRRSAVRDGTRRRSRRSRAGHALEAAGRRGVVRGRRATRCPTVSRSSLHGPRVRSSRSDLRPRSSPPREGRHSRLTIMRNGSRAKRCSPSSRRADRS